MYSFWSDLFADVVPFAADMLGDLVPVIGVLGGISLGVALVVFALRTVKG